LIRKNAILHVESGQVTCTLEKQNLRMSENHLLTVANSEDYLSWGREKIRVLAIGPQRTKVESGMGMMGHKLIW